MVIWRTTWPGDARDRSLFVDRANQIARSIDRPLAHLTFEFVIQRYTLCQGFPDVSNPKNIQSRFDRNEHHGRQYQLRPNAGGSHID